MLKRQFRLPATVRLVKPAFITTPFFTIRIAKNGLEYNRFGFIVPKQVDKRSVVRNRLKRRIRSCIEQMMDNMHVGNDILFFLKKEAIEQTTKQLDELIKQKFAHQKLLKAV